MKRLTAILVAIMILLTMSVPGFAADPPRFTISNSFNAPEFTEVVLKSYLGKSKTVVIKDLKARNISMIEDINDLVNIYVTGTIKAYTAAFQDDKCVGIQIHKFFYTDDSTDPVRKSFLRKFDKFTAEMKKETNFIINNDKDDTMAVVFASCVLKNGQYLTAQAFSEVYEDYTMYTEVTITYYLSTDYAPEG